VTRLLTAEDAGIAEAAQLLRQGSLVAFPTETVYGLGADATSEAAVARVFAAKGRPHFNPLIVHTATAEEAFSLALADARAERLAASLWPGPLTLVLPCRPRCPVALLARAGLETVALRVPAHPVALALICAAAVPIAAPSANRSGAVSPTTAAHVMDGLAGRIAAVLDGGACAVGVESSVLDLTGQMPVLLRPGGATVEAIEASIGPVALPMDQATAEGPRTLRSPGLLLSHYAPVLPVRLDATSVGQDEALLSFGPEAPAATLAFNLSERGDLTEAAARLFAGLRLLDAEGRARGLGRIAAMPVPSRGLGLAINDRLKRAAAPR
jgi:L-threonylcarbamoyladenylate synthase